LAIIITMTNNITDMILSQSSAVTFDILDLK